MSLRLITVLLASVVLLCAAPSLRGDTSEELQKPVTVFFVRHAEAEKSDVTNRNPELTEKGKARAKALARLLSHAGVTHVFATELRRTEDTLGPLVDALHLEVRVIGARESEAQLEALEGLPPGAVAVVAGHSNTVPGMVVGFGGVATDLEEHPRYGGMLAHDSHDRLFEVVRDTGGGVKTIELRYGE